MAEVQPARPAKQPARAMRPLEPSSPDHALVRLARRARRAGARLVRTRAGLADHRIEIVVAVDKRDAPLADRHAAIGLALDAAIDRDKLVGRTFNLNDAVHQ